MKTHMEKGEINLADIRKAVCRHFGINADRIRTHDGRRDGPTARARQVLCWIARGFTHAPWSAIAREAGYAHHDRAISAAQACAADPELVGAATELAWDIAVNCPRAFPERGQVERLP